MQKIEDIKEYLSDIKDGGKVYEFITGIDETTQKGRHGFNENLYVNVVSYETKQDFDGIFESHRDYIDLHILVQGEEKIYYGNKNDMTIAKEYDKSGDYELLKGEKYSSVEYGKMQAVEFTVNEPHMAGYTCKGKQKILKAIVKIRTKI